MYQTITSAPTRFADTVTLASGLRHDTTPVLCCPVAAAVAVVSGVQAAAATYGEQAAQNESPSASTDDEGIVAFGNGVCGSIMPGRLAYTNLPVQDDATVEQLLAVHSAAR